MFANCFREFVGKQNHMELLQSSNSFQLAVETEYKAKQFLKDNREPKVEDLLKISTGFLTTFKL